MANEGTELIGEFKADLEKRKGAFWARKTVFLVGVAFSNDNNKDDTRRLLAKLVASDVGTDLEEKFPGRSRANLIKEIIQDSENLKAALIKFAEGV